MWPFRKRQLVQDPPAALAAGAGTYRAVGGAELLRPHRERVTAIRTLVGVPNTHWERLHGPSIERFAELAQQLPASEAHHHCDPGGLLRHGLEVAVEAIRLRRGLLLPPGAPAESLAHQADAWTFAILTAALLHDIGKPLTDLRVEILHASGHETPWIPVEGPMPVGSVYRIAFNPERRHRRHERFAPLLAHHLVPPAGLSWLAADDALLDAWLAAIQGETDDAGALGSLIGKADALSVAADLSGGVRVQVSGARAKPLATRLLAGLRRLFTEEKLSSNRPGAAAFLSGEELWLVSKRVLDELRETLLQDGQTGIPTRNDRLMDELQQHGLLRPNGDQAVWTCLIRIGGWEQRLTCLRMDAALVWPAADLRPADAGIVVVPVADAAPAGDAVVAASTADASAPPPRPPRGAPGGAGERSEHPANAVESPGAIVPPRASPPAALPLPWETEGSLHPASSAAQDPAPTLPLPFDVALQPGESASTVSAPLQASESIGRTAVDHRDSDAGQEMPVTQEHGDSADASPADTDPDLGKQFVAWLRAGIRARRLKINTVEARLHVLPEGLALVSPGIFRDFDSSQWNLVQKRFQKLKLHRKCPDSTNVWTCRVSKNRKTSLIKVFLIPDPSALLGCELPPPNPAVSLIVGDGSDG